MRLRQTEFCHNCNQYVEFEFDDTTDRQVIYCPRCNHEHYRELDEGTIVNIRMSRVDQRDLKIAVPLPMYTSFASIESEVVADNMITCREFKIIGHTTDGRPIVEKTVEEFGTISTEQTKTVSQRRWGRDRRQG